MPKLKVVLFPNYYIIEIKGKFLRDSIFTPHLTFPFVFIEVFLWFLFLNKNVLLVNISYHWAHMSRHLLTLLKQTQSLQKRAGLYTLIYLFIFVFLSEPVNNLNSSLLLAVMAQVEELGNYFINSIEY